MSRTQVLPESGFSECLPSPEDAISNDPHRPKEVMSFRISVTG